MSLQTRLESLVAAIGADARKRPRTLYLKGSPTSTVGTGWTTLASFVCPPLKEHSILEITLSVPRPTQTGTTKAFRLGASNQWILNMNTANLGFHASRKIQNRGVKNSQLISLSNSTLSSYATNPQADLITTIDTSVATTWVFEGQCAAAGDVLTLGGILAVLYLE
jgi:hypothetical protein